MVRISCLFIGFLLLGLRSYAQLPISETEANDVDYTALVDMNASIFIYDSKIYENSKLIGSLKEGVIKQGNIPYRKIEFSNAGGKKLAVVTLKQKEPKEMSVQNLKTGTKSSVKLRSDLDTELISICRYLFKQSLL